MVGLFKKYSGLIIASTLFAKKPTSQTLPVSLLSVVSEHSNKYDDILLRQAFIDTSIRIFTEATSAEKEYLGGLAQGFFGFHTLGAFGDSAKIRLSEAQDTVWLIEAQVRRFMH